MKKFLFLFVGYFLWLIGPFHFVRSFFSSETTFLTVVVSALLAFVGYSVVLWLANKLFPAEKKERS